MLAWLINYYLAVDDHAPVTSGRKVGTCYVYDGDEYIPR